MFKTPFYVMKYLTADYLKNCYFIYFHEHVAFNNVQKNAFRKKAKDATFKRHGAKIFWLFTWLKL